MKDTYNWIADAIAPYALVAMLAGCIWAAMGFPGVGKGGEPSKCVRCNFNCECSPKCECPQAH